MRVIISMKKNLLYIGIVAVGCIIGVVLLAMKGDNINTQSNYHKNEIDDNDKKSENVTESVSTNDLVGNSDCMGVTENVQKILKENNIDLNRLNRVTSESANMLGYASRPTGYTYKVNNHVTERVFDGVLDRIVLGVCYHDRIILTRDLRLNFINNKVSSVFDFNFVPINVSPIPKVNISEAKKIAYREQSSVSGTEPKLGYYDINAGKGQSVPEYILAWDFGKGARVVIDAHSSKVVYSFNGITY